MSSYRDAVPELALLTLHLFILLYTVLFCLSCLVMMRRGFLIRPKPTGRGVDQPVEPQLPPPPNALTDPSLTIPHIPPELTDQIIDHLHNDRRALKACSRVCRSWSLRSSYHYWHSVKLDIKNYATFEELLRENPDIGQLIKSLKIIVYFFEEKPNWVDEHLPRLGRLLPHVETLTLAGNGTYRAEPFHAFTSVKTLRVLGCEFLSVNEFVTLLCYLPSLEELFSSNVFIGISETLETPSKSYPRPKLKKLEFLATRLDPCMFTDWMIQDGIHEHIESIILRPLQKGALIPVGNFITAVGAGLKHLEIAIIAFQLQGGFRDVIGPHFELTNATDLRTLEFGSPAAYAARYGSDDMSFSWISLMLAQVRSPAIEEVTFWLSHSDMVGLRSTEWEDAVRTLLSDRFKSLRRIHLRVWGADKVMKEMKRLIEAQLKAFHEKNILEFDMHVTEGKAFGYEVERWS